MTLNEAKTRVLHIDPQLRAADWKLNDRTQVRLEVPVDGYDAEPWNGVTDYCLYDASGNVLTVVEAKRATRSPREADEQLRHYVTEIAKKQAFAPFGFMADGRPKPGLTLRPPVDHSIGLSRTDAVYRHPGLGFSRTSEWSAPHGNPAKRSGPLSRACEGAASL